MTLGSRADSVAVALCVSSLPVFLSFGHYETRAIQIIRQCGGLGWHIVCSWSTEDGSSRERRLGGPSVKEVKEDLLQY
jgi:hypothetical protein